MDLSPGRCTCVYLSRDVSFTKTRCPSDGTLSRRSSVLGLIVHVKEPKVLIEEEVRLTLCFGSLIASTFVSRFPQACKLKRLISFMTHPWFITNNIITNNIIINIHKKFVYFIMVSNVASL